MGLISSYSSPRPIGSFSANQARCPSPGSSTASQLKVKADGTGLLYAGYIGGTGRDTAKAIAVDAPGNAYAAGITDSEQGTLPIKVQPSLTAHDGDDVFASKLKPDGSGLVYSAFLGGADLDQASGIALDAAGNAYVNGFTLSDPDTLPS